MNWLTSFSFLLLLFVSQQDYAESRKDRNASKSPWADVNKANAFMKCLIQKIANSPVFPQQEKEDMESIVETMMSAISSMSTSQRGNTKAQLQAMNMAFASSMAELVIAEDAGNMQAIALKTNALSKTLTSCFRSTLGTVNSQFIAEIKDLINVFAQETASAGEDNAIEDQEDNFPLSQSPDYSASQYDTQTNYNLNSFTTSSQQTASDYSSFGIGPSSPAYGTRPSDLGYRAPGGPEYEATGGAGPAGDLSGLTNGLAQALANSKTFRAIFGAGGSPQVKVQIATNAIQSTLSSILRADSNVTLRIKSDLQQTLSGLGAGANVGAIAAALSRTVVSGLSNSGLINSMNAADVGGSLVRGFLQSASGIAPQFGIRVSPNDVSSDISSITNIIQTSVSSQTTGISPSILSIDTGAPEGFDFGGPGIGAGPAGVGYEGSGGAGYPVASVDSLLSSPSGLTSPRATARIQGLVSGIVKSLGPNGLDVGILTKGLASASSDAVNSGLSPNEAKIEALLETMAALIQILSSAQVGSVNMSSVSGVSSSLASSLSSVLV